MRSGTESYRRKPNTNHSPRVRAGHRLLPQLWSQSCRAPWPAKPEAMLLSDGNGWETIPDQLPHSLLGMSGEINLSAGMGWLWRAVSTDHSHPGIAAMP